jgi:hypothetical protein
MTMVRTKKNQHPKKLGERYTALKNNLTNTRQKSFFLMCESCFWMASTLNYLKSIDNLSSIFRQCPICENNIDRFTIPSDLN